MENKEIKFKTNLNCGGCVSKVRADLDSTIGVEKWNVDTANPDKILTVSSDTASNDEVIAIIKSKGFTAEVID